MGAAKKLIDKKVLRDLIPINALSAVHLQEISKKAVIEDVQSGRYVFKAGDSDNQTVYLLDGQVELFDGDRKLIETVSAGSEVARHPLAHKQPRQLGARASGKVTVARVDSSLLDVLLTWDESAGYDVVELDANDGDDWMTRMLQSQAFMQLPPSNIHQLLMRLEAVTVNAGDVIVRQGDEGDYFYIVKTGRLAVTRKASARSKEVLLAELGEGACFGEEALVSGTRRNASVMMITDGSLMRLSKHDFNELLCASLVHEADFEGALKLVAKGATWLDVRLPGEFGNQAIKDSINLPLSALRDECEELDKSTDYIVVCDTGRRSAAGAFVLSQRGFSVYTLKNGLMDVPDDALTSAQKEAASSSAAARDAEIIPFGSDKNEEGDDESAQAASSGDSDTVLIDRLAAAESDKQALSRQLKALQGELDQARSQARLAQEKQEGIQSELRQAREQADAVRGEFQSNEQALQQRVELAEQEKHTLESELAAFKGDLESSRRRHETVETEKKALEDELHRIQQTLAQIQASAEGRDDALRSELDQMVGRLETERQTHARRQQELETELNRVREDYQQLGQRTSAVAGERDAAARELSTLTDQLSDLQEQLESSQASLRKAGEDHQLQLERLQDRLSAAEQKQQSGETERAREVEALHRQLEQVQTERAAEQEELAQGLEAARGEVQARATRQEELQQLVEDLQGQLAAANEQRQSLETQLEERRSEGDQADSEYQNQLGQLRADHAAEKEELNRNLDSVRNQLDAQTTGYEELQQQVNALQEQLAAAGERGQSLEAQLEERRTEGEQAGAEYQQQLEQVRTELAAEKDGLSRDLESVRQELEVQTAQREELQQRVEDLQGQLDTASEQTQSLQEQLEAQRTAGEQSDAGLKQQVEEAATKVTEFEAELTAERQSREQAEQRSSELEEQLQTLNREHAADLTSAREATSRAHTETENIKREQIRLMESMRKLERDLERERQDHETEVHRLHKELKQAAGGSGDGLAAELEALQIKIKEDARERDDLEIKLGERSAQLEMIQAEAAQVARQLEQARESARQAEQQLIEANQAANEEMAIRMEAEEKAQLALRDELATTIAERNKIQENLAGQAHEIDELRQAMANLQEELETREQSVAVAEQARDEAIDAQQQTQQEIDQLRAEAEVTRGLVDMAAPSDEALKEQLVQAQQNVDVAVRLRTQAEERVAQLEREIEQLKESGAAQVGEQSSQEHTPSQEADYHDTSSLFSPAPSTQAEPGAAPVSAASVATAPVTSTAGGGWRRLFVGIVAGAVIAGGGAWWTLKPQGESPAWKTHTDKLLSGIQAFGVDDNATGAAEAGEREAADTDTIGISNPPDDVVVPVDEVPAEPGEPDAERKEVANEPVPASIPSFAKGSSLPEPIRNVSSVVTDTPAETAGAETTTAVEADEQTAGEVFEKSTEQPVRTFSETLASGGRGPRMAEFQADSFLMGSGVSSPNFDERPRHRVELKPFAISQREITFTEYDQFARDTGRRRPKDAGWGRGDRPVINVSWADAVAYTQWLSRQTGSRYRLPTEAEWEFAARSGTPTRFWWGNKVGKGNANCFDCGSQWSGKKTAPVGSFAASAFGLHDMLGNVMEWVEDCYTGDYNQAPDDGAAVVQDGCAQRVVRGGSYSSPSGSIRSADRNSMEPGTRLGDLGFRVVKEK